MPAIKPAKHMLYHWAMQVRDRCYNSWNKHCFRKESRVPSTVSAVWSGLCSVLELNTEIRRNLETSFPSSSTADKAIGDHRYCIIFCKPYSCFITEKKSKSWLPDNSDGSVNSAASQEARLLSQWLRVTQRTFSFCLWKLIITGRRLYIYIPGPQCIMAVFVSLTSAF